MLGDSIGDGFGRSVAINNSGTILVVGAPFDDDAGTNAGSALIYTGSEQAGWTLKQKITGDSAGDEFGYSVKINSFGNILSMGSRSDNNSTGAVLVYTGNALGGWSQIRKLIGSNQGNNFGFSHDINDNGNIIIAGEYLDDTAGTNAGAASVYEICPNVQLTAPTLTIPSLTRQDLNCAFGACLQTRFNFTATWTPVFGAESYWVKITNLEDGVVISNTNVYETTLTSIIEVVNTIDIFNNQEIAYVPRLKIEVQAFNPILFNTQYYGPFSNGILVGGGIIFS